MELREGMKFNDHGDLIELSYYDEDDDSFITWIDTDGNNWEDGYILSGLKSNNLELISYPYEVGDYVVITKHQQASKVGSVVKLTTVSKNDVNYVDANYYPTTKFIADINCIRPAFQHEINNIKKEKMKETEFKVGDWVKITKSDSNWNRQMDIFDGKIVQITSITSDNSIRFENDDAWQWEYKSNHFVKVDASTTLLSPEEQERMLLGYACVDFDSNDWMIDTKTAAKYDTTSMEVISLDYLDFMTGSSSPTISIIKSKTKKSMFKSDIISF